MRFRLYIAGEAPNSIRARSNLAALCRDFPQSGHEVEVVDVLKEPLRALGDGILVTPTLIRLEPEPIRHIIGDLSDRERVLLLLGLDKG